MFAVYFYLSLENNDAKSCLRKVALSRSKFFFNFCNFCSKRDGNWAGLRFVTLDTDNSNWYQPRHIFVHILATL
jgi:hypothetical protein